MFMPYFYDLGLRTKIISVLDKLGFECPTSVQNRIQLLMYQLSLGCSDNVIYR